MMDELDNRLQKGEISEFEYLQKQQLNYEEVVSNESLLKSLYESIVENEKNRSKYSPVPSVLGDDVLVAFYSISFIQFREFLKLNPAKYIQIAKAPVVLTIDKDSKYKTISLGITKMDAIKTIAPENTRLLIIHSLIEVVGKTSRSWTFRGYYMRNNI